MIDKSDYCLSKTEQKRKKTEEEKRQSAETLAYLESLPWKPFDQEW